MIDHNARRIASWSTDARARERVRCSRRSALPSSCRSCCSSRLGEFLAARRSTDWDDTLWVDVYLVNGDRLESTQRYVDTIDAKEFEGVERVLRSRSETLRRLDRPTVSAERRRAIPRRAPGDRRAPVDSRDDLVEPRDALARVQARLATQRAETGHRRVRDLSRLGRVGRARSVDGAAQRIDRRDQLVRIARRARHEPGRARARAPAHARRDGQILAGVEPSAIPRRVCRADAQAAAAAEEGRAHGRTNPARRTARRDAGEPAQRRRRPPHRAEIGWLHE